MKIYYKTFFLSAIVTLLTFLKTIELKLNHQISSKIKIIKNFEGKIKGNERKENIFF